MPRVKTLLNIPLAMLTSSLLPTVPVELPSWEDGGHTSQEKRNAGAPFVLERICHNRYHCKINKHGAKWVPCYSSPFLSKIFHFSRIFCWSVGLWYLMRMWERWRNTYWYNNRLCSVPRVLSKHICPDSEPPNEGGSDPTVLEYI